MEIAPDTRLAIGATLTRLMHSLDRNDIDGFADCWAQDVDFEVRFPDGCGHAAQGRAAIVALTAPGMAKGPGKLRHVLGPVEILAIENGRARTFSYCTYYTVGEECGFAGIGEYEDELTREADGVWRISRRRHTFLNAVKTSL